MIQALVELEPASPVASRQGRSRLITDLIAASEHLASQDRVLINSVYKHGVPPAALATARGQSPGCVYHRLRRLARRIHSPLFCFVVLQRFDWPADQRAVAESIILRGQTQRMTAASLGTSVHKVRILLNRVRALFEHVARDAARTNSTHSNTSQSHSSQPLARSHFSGA